MKSFEEASAVATMVAPWSEIEFFLQLVLLESAACHRQRTYARADTPLRDPLFALTKQTALIQKSVYIYIGVQVISRRSTVAWSTAYAIRGRREDRL